MLEKSLLGHFTSKQVLYSILSGYGRQVLERFSHLQGWMDVPRFCLIHDCTRETTQAQVTKISPQVVWGYFFHCIPTSVIIRGSYNHRNIYCHDSKVKFCACAGAFSRSLKRKHFQKVTAILKCFGTNVTPWNQCFVQRHISMDRFNRS